VGRVRTLFRSVLCGRWSRLERNGFVIYNCEGQNPPTPEIKPEVVNA
jgi:hypothetical protein